ncbi:MAG: DUF1501 domain-containing protein [Spirosomaceae bacterium]|nr:DUF1501 domain-containing protein [Spirosomataceae bacterium]
MNRRDFIKQSGCAAMGTTTLLSTLTNLTTFNGALGADIAKSAPPSDYKALVCILLAGGIDSYNTLVPMGNTPGGDNGYNEYSALRTDLAIDRNQLLALNNPQCSSFRGIPCQYGAFGVHPTMTGMRDLFNTGKVAFMANIGTLVEPIMNKTEYQSGLKKLPLGIYSHSDQIMQWQTSVPQSRDALGVGGRLADLLHASNTYQEISMNFSLSGKNAFQRGQTITEYSISNNIDPNNVGFQALPSWWSNSGYLTQVRDNAIDSLVSKTYANLLQKTYSTATKNSTAAFDIFKQALTKVPSMSTAFGTDELSRNMQAIAKVISVREFLGTKRQIFFVTYGGWDMHSNLLTGMNQRVPVVSQALKSFYDATVELGIADKVTTFTISDFARTVTSNGQGSDHAWGGNTIVMGGSVNGGKIYGSYPKMDVATYNRNISFRGNFIPAVSTDEFYAELALWYGVSPNDLCYVLPNLGNFYSYAANQYPVGFMNFNGTAISNEDLPPNCLSY